MREGWDLADFYRDNLTLRQVWVRIKALPPGSPLHIAIDREQETADRDRMAADVHAALGPFRR